MAMSLAGLSFSPHQVHGNAGDTVSLTLSGGAERHTFIIDAFGVNVTIPEGETREISFLVPVDGITPFYCRLHGTPDSGMHGLLIFH